MSLFSNSPLVGQATASYFRMQSTSFSMTKTAQTAAPVKEEFDSLALSNVALQRMQAMNAQTEARNQELQTMREEIAEKGFEEYIQEKRAVGAMNKLLDRMQFSYTEIRVEITTITAQFNTNAPRSVEDMLDQIREMTSGLPEGKQMKVDMMLQDIASIMKQMKLDELEQALDNYDAAKGEQAEA